MSDVKLLTESLERLTGRKVLLKEVATPKLDIDSLEKEYKTLTPKLKEVMPTNIKEWMLFQKQINNLWSLYSSIRTNPEKVKEIFTNNIKVDKYGSLEGIGDAFEKAVLDNMPYKHSLLEVTDTYYNSGGLKQGIAGYLWHNGFDINNFFFIKNWFENTIVNYYKNSKKELQKQSIEKAKSNAAAAGELFVPSGGRYINKKTMALVKKANPSVIKVDYLVLDDDIVEFLNSIPNLKLIKGTVEAYSWYGVNIKLNATIDELYVNDAEVPEKFKNLTVNTYSFFANAPNFYNPGTIKKVEKQFKESLEELNKVINTVKPLVKKIKIEVEEDDEGLGEYFGEIDGLKIYESGHQASIKTQDWVNYLKKKFPGIEIIVTKD